MTFLSQQRHTAIGYIHYSLAFLCMIGSSALIYTADLSDQTKRLFPLVATHFDMLKQLDKNPDLASYFMIKNLEQKATLQKEAQSFFIFHPFEHYFDQAKARLLLGQPLLTTANAQWSEVAPLDQADLLIFDQSPLTKFYLGLNFAHQNKLIEALDIFSGLSDKPYARYEAAKTALSLAQQNQAPEESKKLLTRSLAFVEPLIANREARKLHTQIKHCLDTLPKETLKAEQRICSNTACQAALPLSQTIETTSSEQKHPSVDLKSRYDKIALAVSAKQPLAKNVLKELFNLIHDLPEYSYEDTPLDKANMVEFALTLMEKNPQLEEYGLTRLSELEASNFEFCHELFTCLNCYHIQNISNENKRKKISISICNKALKFLGDNDETKNRKIELLLDLRTMYEQTGEHDKLIKTTKDLYLLDKDTLPLYIEALLSSISQKNVPSNTLLQRATEIEKLLPHMPSQTIHDQFIASFFRRKFLSIKPNCDPTEIQQELYRYTQLSYQLGQPLSREINLNLYSFIEKDDVEPELMSYIIFSALASYRKLLVNKCLYSEEESQIIRKAFICSSSKISALTDTGGVYGIANAISLTTDDAKKNDLLNQLMVLLEQDKNKVHRYRFGRFLASHFPIYSNPINMLHTLMTYYNDCPNIFSEPFSFPLIDPNVTASYTQILATRDFFIKTYFKELTTSPVLLNLYSFILMNESLHHAKKASISPVNHTERLKSLEGNISSLSSFLQKNSSQLAIAHFVSCVEHWAYVASLARTQDDRSIVSYIDRQIDFLRKNAISNEIVEMQINKLGLLQKLIIYSSDQFKQSNRSSARGSILKTFPNVLKMVNGSVNLYTHLITPSDIYLTQLVTSFISQNTKTVPLTTT